MENSLFHELPVEVRLLIWEHTLRHPKPIKVIFSRPWGPSGLPASSNIKPLGSTRFQFAHVFEYTQYIRFSSTVVDNEKGISNNHSLPPLLHICRAIRSEALPVFFTANTFYINGSPAGILDRLGDFSEGIGVKNTAYLRSLIFAIGELNITPRQRATRSFKELQNCLLEIIRMKRAEWRSCRLRAKVTFVLRSHHPGCRCCSRHKSFRMDLDFDDAGANWEQNVENARISFGDDILMEWNGVKGMLEALKEKLVSAVREGEGL